MGEGIEKYKNQQKFFHYIQSLPRFELCLGRLEKRTYEIPDEIYERIKDIHPQKIFESYAEKGVDVHLAIDMLKLAYTNSYDTGILVAGDGDFVSAVKSVQDLGKKVINAYFWYKEEKNGSIIERKGFHLKNVCDDFVELNSKFLDDCIPLQSNTI